MRQTSFHGDDDHRRNRTADGLAAANERLTRDLDTARAHERTLMFELANTARDLHEKDFLLREAEHRLKNTLHLAYGLLLSQARTAGGKDARDELQAAGERLKAVAEIQAGLHEIGESVQIDKWLPDVCRSMALKPGIELDVRAPSMTISGAIASPMGLFACEAVCNAMKHAFPDDEAGQVQVQFEQEEGGEWRLSIADDGWGGPGQIEPGFGLRLLGLLARQLRGRMEIGRGLYGRGLRVAAVFPLPEAAGPNPNHR